MKLYCCDTGICPGQKPIGEKTNEIPAAQKVSMLDVGSIREALESKGSSPIFEIVYLPKTVYNCIG